MKFNPLYFNNNAKEGDPLSLKSPKGNIGNYLFADIIKVYNSEIFSSIRPLSNHGNFLEQLSALNETSGSSESVGNQSPVLTLMLTGLFPELQKLFSSDDGFSKPEFDVQKNENHLCFQGNISKNSFNEFLLNLLDKFKLGSLSSKNQNKEIDNTVGGILNIFETGKNLSIGISNANGFVQINLISQISDLSGLNDGVGSYHAEIIADENIFEKNIGKLVKFISKQQEEVNGAKTVRNEYPSLEKIPASAVTQSKNLMFNNIGNSDRENAGPVVVNIEIDDAKIDVSSVTERNVNQSVPESKFKVNDQNASVHGSKITFKNEGFILSIENKSGLVINTINAGSNNLQIPLQNGDKIDQAANPLKVKKDSGIVSMTSLNKKDSDESKSGDIKLAFPKSVNSGNMDAGKTLKFDKQVISKQETLPENKINGEKIINSPDNGSAKIKNNSELSEILQNSVSRNSKEIKLQNLKQIKDEKTLNNIDLGSKDKLLNYEQTQQKPANSSVESIDLKSKKFDLMENTIRKSSEKAEESNFERTVKTSESNKGMTIKETPGEELSSKNENILIRAGKVFNIKLPDDETHNKPVEITKDKKDNLKIVAEHDENVQESNSNKIKESFSQEKTLKNPELHRTDKSFASKDESVPVKNITSNTRVDNDTSGKNSLRTESDKNLINESGYNNKETFNSSNNPEDNQSDSHQTDKKSDQQSMSFAKEVSNFTKANGGNIPLSPENPKTIRYADLVKEISRFLIDRDKNSITFKLEPETLGKLKITLDVIENGAKVHIEVENEAVKKLVENNITSLFQNLNQNGLTLLHLQVSTSSQDQKQTRPGSSSRKKFDLDKEIITNNEEKTRIKNYGYNTYEFLA